jgi:hypothetical protein
MKKVSKRDLLRWLREQELEFLRRERLDVAAGTRNDGRARDAAHVLQFVIGHVRGMKRR